MRVPSKIVPFLMMVSNCVIENLPVRGPAEPEAAVVGFGRNASGVGPLLCCHQFGVSGTYVWLTIDQRDANAQHRRRRVRLGRFPVTGLVSRPQVKPGCR